MRSVNVELRIAPEERFAVIHRRDFTATLARRARRRFADFGIHRGAGHRACPVGADRGIPPAAAMAQVLRFLRPAFLAAMALKNPGSSTTPHRRPGDLAGPPRCAGPAAADGLRPPPHEGMGRVLVEAMICRLPVVATRFSGIPDVVESGITGLLVEPRAPEKMAEAITALLGNRAAARALGEAGFRKAVPGFGVEAMVARIEALYARVLQEKGIALAPEPEPPRVGLPR